MRKLVAKFYDGTGEWAEPVDKAIRVISSPYVHVEVMFEDNQSFSSSQRKDMSKSKGKATVEGVRFKTILYTHTERWKEVVLWVTDAEYKRIRLRCEILASLGLDYDMRGAMGCIFTGKQDPEKYFCSEVFYDAVCAEWMPVALNQKMLPQKLYEIVLVLADNLNARWV
jgi:hypothetical protein